jgi:hypothetical protein
VVAAVAAVLQGVVELAGEVLGDVGGARAGGHAEHALTTLPGAPPWHYYRSPAFWDLERGRALYLLPGRARKAADLLTAGLDALPPEQMSADWVMAYRRDLDAARCRCG